MADSTLQLLVKKATDENKIKDELKELDPKFYAKCLVLIDKRKSMERNTGDVVKKMTLTGANLHQIIVLNLQNKMNPTKHQKGYIFRKARRPFVWKVINRRKGKRIQKQNLSRALINLFRQQ